MSFENLVPGHVLTEADVIGVLKEGDSYREWLAGCARQTAEFRLSYEEMIENAALGKSSLSDAVPKNRKSDYDSVYHDWQDANTMLKEEEAFISRQQKNIQFAGFLIRRIWNSFYHMDPQLQEILKGYYIRKECAEDIAKRLDISVTTFWRKRKRAVSSIVRDCSVYL